MTHLTLAEREAKMPRSVVEDHAASFLASGRSIRVCPDRVSCGSPQRRRKFNAF